LRRKPSALHRGVVVGADTGEAGFELLLARVADHHVQAGVRAGHRDAATHRSSADNRHGVDWWHRRVLRDSWNLGRAAFGEEDMNERLALLRLRAVVEDAALAHAAFVERKRGRGLDGVDHRTRRLEVAARFLCELASGGE